MTEAVDLMALQRALEERAAANWDPAEAAIMARAAASIGRRVTDEPDLAALQAEASARAEANWDRDEAALMDRSLGMPVGLAVADALEAMIETGPNKTPFLGEAYLRDYLRGDHWKAVRTRALARAGGYCARCRGRFRQLEVHHLTYRNLGQERESELIVLCHACHETEHGRTF